MLFLHKHKKVAHLDIKSHNILMDQDRPKIGGRMEHRRGGCVYSLCLVHDSTIAVSCALGLQPTLG